MTDEERNDEVQNDEREETVLPVVPLPVGGMTAVGGQLTAAAGGLNPATAGIAPLTGGAATFAAGHEPNLYEDSDMMVADRVEEVLAEDGRLGTANIAVAVAEGTVELTGSVPSERERETAAEICARVPGVRSVENRLTVE